MGITTEELNLITAISNTPDCHAIRIDKSSYMEELLYVSLENRNRHIKTRYGGKSIDDLRDIQGISTLTDYPELYPLELKYCFEEGLLLKTLIRRL